MSLEIQEELKVITDKIIEMINPKMIILFGSYARGEMVNDEYFENGIRYQYKSDYDILILTESEYSISPITKKKIRRKVKKTELVDTELGLISHGIEFFNQELETGNYFFCDIHKEGIILHSTNENKLSEPKALYGEERQLKAAKYFNNWYSSANEFLIDCKNAIERKSYQQAAFLLHQATERLYTTVLLVFTDYKPKMHDLDQLDKQVSNLDATFKTIFPRTTENDERLFGILKKAYIDARYKLDYTIDSKDLNYLFERVQKLQQLTEQASKRKIDSFHSN